MKLRIRRGEIDQIIGMSKNGHQLRALSVVEKGANLAHAQRSREPLHVILHKHLHRRALDRTCAFDRCMDPAADRHVRTQENWMANWRTTRRGVCRSFYSATRSVHCAIIKNSSAATSDDSGFLRPCTRKICRTG